MNPLSFGEREEVRRMIDAARRSAIDWDADLRCSACGVEQLDPDSRERRYLSGCRTCADRRSGHRRRG